MWNCLEARAEQVLLLLFFNQSLTPVFLLSLLVVFISSLWSARKCWGKRKEVLVDSQFYLLFVYLRIWLKSRYQLRSLLAACSSVVIPSLVFIPGLQKLHTFARGSWWWPPWVPCGCPWAMFSQVACFAGSLAVWPSFLNSLQTCGFFMALASWGMVMFTEKLVYDTEVGCWMYPSGVMKTKLWKPNPQDALLDER